MQQDKIDHENKESDFSGIINKIKNYLLEYYEPVPDPREAEMHFTTNEVWQKVLQLFPNSEILTIDLVVKWLYEGGFTFSDFGEMRLEWIMKSKPG